MLCAFQTLQSNQYVQESIAFSLEVSELVHAIQIERGSTALYVSSGGDPFLRPKLLALYRDTDNAIYALSKWVPVANSKDFASKEVFRNSINEFRDKLDPLIITLKDVIDFYTADSTFFIDLVSNSLNLQRPFPYWAELVSYQMLIYSKEQAGIERALGSTYFARGNYMYT